LFSKPKTCFSGKHSRSLRSQQIRLSNIPTGFLGTKWSVNLTNSRAWLKTHFPKYISLQTAECNVKHVNSSSSSAAKVICYSITLAFIQKIISTASWLKRMLSTLRFVHARGLGQSNIFLSGNKASWGKFCFQCFGQHLQVATRTIFVKYRICTCSWSRMRRIQLWRTSANLPNMPQERKKNTATM